MSNKHDISYFYVKPTNMDFDLFWGNLKPHHKFNEEPSQDEYSFKLNVEEFYDSLKASRKGLLLECGYTEKDVKRANNIDDFLYLKHGFILKNTVPKWNLLKIYLADQEILFSYSDERYWRRQVSRDAVSARNRLSRDSNARKQLARSLLVWKEIEIFDEAMHKEEPTVPIKDRKLYIDLLEKITDIAAKKHMSLDHWVNNNIYRATPSVDERMAVVTKTNLTETEERERRNIIELIIADELCSFFMQGSEAYSKAEQNVNLFQELMPEHKDRINPSFCRIFVNIVLPNYLKKIRLAVEPQYQPKNIAEIDTIRLAILFFYYERRAYLLDDLHSRFIEKQKSKMDLSGTKYFAFCEGKLTASESENAIITAIQTYFRHIDKPLRDDPQIRDEPRNYLLRRVHWASKVIRVC